MAISAAVFVGGFERWRQPLIDCAKALKVGQLMCLRPLKKYAFVLCMKYSDVSHADRQKERTAPLGEG